MRKSAKKAFWVLGALVAVLGLAAPKLMSWWGTRSAAPPSKAAGSADRRSGGGVAVTTLELKSEPLDETVAIVGTLRPEEAIELQTEIAAKIAEIAFVEGAAVHAGDLLLRLDDAEAQAELNRARARITKAESLEKRLRGLMQSGWTNEQEFEQAQSDFLALRAERELAEAKLAKTVIRAPFDGVVGIRSVSLGSYVAPTAKITTLQKVSRLKLDFAVAERHAARLRPGAAVRFRVSGDTQEYAASVYVIEPRIDEATRTVLVRAMVDNSAGKLRPGALAQVSLTLEHWENALLVPAMAIVTDDQGKGVFVVEHGKASRRNVETGLRRREQVQITNGLKSGELVVVAGVQSLQAGSSVKLVAAK